MRRPRARGRLAPRGEGSAQELGLCEAVRRRARDAFRTLRVRNFSLFWAGQMVSGIGTWMQTIAMAWLVLEVSRSPGVLGTVTMLQFLPMLLFALQAGVLADRFPKRKLLLATQGLATLQALLLGTVTLIGAPLIWELAVLAFLLGLSNAFNNPAQQAFIPEMVGRALVPDAVAMNAIQFNATRMIGFALGGLALAQFSAAAVFFINSATFAASLASLLLMRPGELHPPLGQRPGHRALREGMGYVFRTPAVLFVLASLAVVGTFGFNWPVAAPLIAQDLVEVKAVGFGALMAALGAGSLLAGAVLLMLRGGGERRIVIAGGVLAIVLMALGVSRSYPFSLMLMFAAGASGTVFTTTANSSLQALVPDSLRGRVMSLFVLLMAGTTPVGSTILGWGADAVGVSGTIVVFGAATAAGLAALILRQRPALGSPARAKTHEPPPDAIPPTPTPLG